MVKYSFVFAIVFVIGMLLLFSHDAATSLSPGWHTTVYTPWFFVSLFQTIWLGIAALIYYILERKGRAVSHSLFLVHIILSLFLFAGDIFMYIDSGDAASAAAIMPLSLFVLGQIVFVVGVLRAKKVAAAVPGK